MPSIVHAAMYENVLVIRDTARRAMNAAVDRLSSGKAQNTNVEIYSTGSDMESGAASGVLPVPVRLRTHFQDQPVAPL